MNIQTILLAAIAFCVCFYVALDLNDRIEARHLAASLDPPRIEATHFDSIDSALK